MPKSANRATRQVKRTAPEEVRSEVLAPPHGTDTIYWLVLGTSDVEKLASGRCSQALIEEAYRMLSWQREADQDWAHYEPASGATK